MNSEEYEKICKESKSGIQKFVENTQTRQTGLVIDCRKEEFVVETEGQRDTWPAAKCRERSYYIPSYSR